MGILILVFGIEGLEKGLDTVFRRKEGCLEHNCVEKWRIWPENSLSNSLEAAIGRPSVRLGASTVFEAPDDLLENVPTRASIHATCYAIMHPY